MAKMYIMPKVYKEKDDSLGSKPVFSTKLGCCQLLSPPKLAFLNSPSYILYQIYPLAPNMMALACLFILMPLVAALPTPGAQTTGTQYPWTDTQISNVEVKCHEPKDQGLRSCNMKCESFKPI